MECDSAFWLQKEGPGWALETRVAPTLLQGGEELVLTTKLFPLGPSTAGKGTADHNLLFTFLTHSFPFP